MRGTATRWLLLLAAAAAAGVWFFVDRASHVPGGVPDAVTQGVERDLTEGGAGDGGLHAPPTGGNDRLVAVAPREVEKGTAQSGQLTEVRNLPPQRAGTIRFQGRVQVEDNAPFVSNGAVVRVYHDTTSDVPKLLGDAPVGASGQFWLDVGALGDHSPASIFDPYVYGVLIAPGYERSENGESLSQAVDGVLNVELNTSSGLAMCRGQAITAAGEPIAGAVVRFIDWGIVGENMAEGEVRTDEDGRYSFEAQPMAWVDALITHPSQGVGKVGGRFESGSWVLDLGLTVLVPRNLVSGVLRHYGGGGLPGIQMYAESADPDVEATSQDILTDERGRFRFANLDAITYRISHDFAEDDSETIVAKPGAVNLDYSLGRPTVLVKLEDQAGRPVEPSSFLAAAFDPERGRRAKNGVGSTIDQLDTTNGGRLLILDKPGHIVIAGQTWVDGKRWNATRVINVGREHKVVTLRFEREASSPVRFAVSDTDGSPMEAWNVLIRDPRSGMGLGSIKHDQSGTTELAPGDWVAHITPKGTSMALPFSADIQIPKGGTEPTTVELRAKSSGGRLRISTRASAGLARTPELKKGGHSLVRISAKKNKMGGSLKMPMDGVSRLHPFILRPGSYTVTMLCIGSNRKHAKATAVVETVEVRAGEIVDISALFTPAQ